MPCTSSANCRRSDTPSFSKTADRWALTVRSVMPSASAIWAWPAAGRVTGGGGLALGQQAAIPVAGVLAFLGHQAQQAADQERPIQMPPVEMTSRACASACGGRSCGSSLGRPRPGPGCPVRRGAGAGDQQAEAGQGLRPGGVLPGRQPRQVGVQHGQGTALVAPALQVGQPAPAGNQPALGIELSPALPQQIVVRNQQDGNGFHKAFSLSSNQVRGQRSVKALALARRTGLSRYCSTVRLPVRM